MHYRNYLSGLEQKKIKKKILFLSTLPPPYHGASMSSAMCLDILKSDNTIEVKNIKLNNSVEVSDLGKVTFNKLYGILRISKQIKYLIKNFNPDIIYFAPAVTGYALIRDFFFLKIIKAFSRGKLILHIRGQFKKREWDNLFTKFIIKSLLQCDKAIVLGPELIVNLNNTIPLKDIYILPNAIIKTISDTEFKNIMERKGINSDLKLLFLSNMAESKGWFKVLETCKLLIDAGIKFKCDFVGDWPSDYERQNFYRYIKNNNLSSNVVHHGQLLNKEKNNIFEGADILIFPTVYDACPRVIIEAMEFGLPVISNNVGTIPSLIEHGKTGFILERNQAVEIFGYIIKLQDKDYRNVMGIKSRERFLEKFTLDKYRSKFIAIINQD